MKRQHLWLSALTIFLTIGLFFFFNEETGIKPPDERGVTSVRQLEEVEEEEPLIKPIKKPARALSSITPAEVSTLRNSFPDKVDVKAEAGQDPHKTPASLIKFAETLGPLVEKALKNKHNAILLVNELHDCALDESVAQSARALCLSKAEKLANVYPQIKEKVGKTRELASPDVIRLEEKKNLFLKR